MIPVRTSVEVDEIPGAVIGLIVANAAVFLYLSGLPESVAQEFIDHNALVPARYTQPGFARAHDLDPVNVLPLLTNTFMHAGWLHLIVNMWTLWLFGRPLEERLGAPRFIVFYLLCGALASMAHLAFNLGSTVPALGASGAIAGVLGGYTLLYPRAKVHLLTLVLFFPATWRLPAVVYTAIWFVFQLVPAIVQLVQGMAGLAAPEESGGIAWWAHIGGFLAGLALVTLAGAPKRKVRQIGPPRGAMREIGTQRVGTVRVGPRRRRFQSVRAGRRRFQAVRAGRRGSVPPAAARRTERPAVARAASKALAGTPRYPPGVLEDADWPEDADWEAPVDSTATTRRRGPWG